MSRTELTKVRDALARALSVDAVNQREVWEWCALHDSNND